MITSVEAFKESMEKYNEKRIAWVEQFGNSEGFDAWFTKQVVA